MCDEKQLNNDEEFFVDIDDATYIFDFPYTIFQACLKVDILVPRFCYHNRLKIAGNCRVCFIEEIKSVKPIISCATLIAFDSEIFTRTEIALEGREAVIEYLLINHPLDCPICDQGGERDSQDQTLIYGSDRGRYYELKKRAVENKNYSPLIKFFLNRCIHCARCTRFSSEVTSSFLLSLMGRGLDTEISSYLSKPFIDELSGNIIDLCPVGASTSKPYSFTARVWEVFDVRSIDIFDTLNSMIKVEYRGASIIRVLPIPNEDINEEWISDKIRFNYDSYMNQRLINCMFILYDRFYYYSWANSLVYYRLYFTFNTLGHLFKRRRFTEYHNKVSNFVDLFFFFKLKRLLNSVSVRNFYSENSLLSFRHNFYSNVSLNDAFESSNVLKLLIILGVNLRFESPVFNLKLKLLFDDMEDDDNILIFNFGFCYNSNYFIDYIGNNMLAFIRKLYNFYSALELVEFNIILKSSLENNTLHGKYFYFLLSNLFSYKMNFIIVNSNSSVLMENESYFKSTTVAQGMQSLHSGSLNFYFSDDNKVLNTKHFLKTYFGHHFIDRFNKYVNLLLPIKFFIEKSICYINLEGFVQNTSGSNFDYKYDTIKKESEVIDIIGRLLAIKLYRIGYEKNYNYNSFLPDFKKINTTALFYKLIFDGSFYDFSTNISAIFKYFNIIFKSEVNNYYASDYISKLSLVMSICSNRFTLKNDFNYVYFLNNI